MRDFADDVRGCLETLRAMNKVQEVDSQDRMIQILSRLPVYVQARWRQEACKVKRISSRYPNFEEFVEFVDLQAEELCDPVFGQIEWTSQDKRQQVTKPNSRKPAPGYSFSVHSPETDAGRDAKPKRDSVDHRKDSLKYVANHTVCRSATRLGIRLHKLAWILQSRNDCVSTV